MKKNIILLFLIAFIFLLSGCSIENNIVIKSNGSIYQNGTIVINKKINKSEQNDIRKKIIDEYSILNNDLDISFNDKINVKSSEKYNNLSKYLEKSNIDMMFDDYEIIENNDSVSFYIVGHPIYYLLMYMQEDIKLEKYQELVDKIIINIQFENEVITSNADEINKKENVYTWIFDKNDLEKDIKFEYNKNKKIINLEEKNISKKKNNNFFIGNKRLILFLVVLLLAGLFILYKKR